MWNDRKVRDLTRSAAFVWVFILTNPRMTSLGIMHHSLEGLAQEIRPWFVEEDGQSEGLTEGFPDAFDKVKAKGLFLYEKREAIIAIPNFLKHNPPESVNVVKSWASLADEIPECAFKTAYLAHVLEQSKTLPKSFQEALPSCFRDAALRSNGRLPLGLSEGKGLGKPFPEPEPELEPELEKEIPASAVPEPGARSSPSKNGKPKTKAKAEVSEDGTRAAEIHFEHLTKWKRKAAITADRGAWIRKAAVEWSKALNSGDVESIEEVRSGFSYVDRSTAGKDGFTWRTVIDSPTELFKRKRDTCKWFLIDGQAKEAVGVPANGQGLNGRQDDGFHHIDHSKYLTGARK
jgi:hypothetical protein